MRIKNLDRTFPGCISVRDLTPLSHRKLACNATVENVTANIVGHDLILGICTLNFAVLKASSMYKYPTPCMAVYVKLMEHS